ELPDELDVSPESEQIFDPAFHFQWSCAVDRRTITLTYTYQSLRDNVETTAVAKHLAALDRVRENLGYRVDYAGKAGIRWGSLAPRAGGGGLGRSASLFWIGLFGLIGLTWATAAIRAARRKRPLQGGVRVAAGDTAARPLQADDEQGPGAALGTPSRPRRRPRP